VVAWLSFLSRAGTARHSVLAAEFWRAPLLRRRLVASARPRFNRPRGSAALQGHQACR
jgi:hypothetical protein